jgi:hypothetical protein
MTDDLRLYVGFCPRCRAEERGTYEKVRRWLDEHVTITEHNCAYLELVK